MAKKNFSFESVVEFFLPKEELEPTRRQAVQTYLTASIYVVVLLIFLNILWVFIGAKHASLVCNSMLAAVIIALACCKAGFPDLYRILYAAASGITILFATQLLGSESFAWVYTLQAFSANFLVTAPSEVRLRKILTIVSIVCLFLTMVVSLTGIIPSEVPASGHQIVVYFGNFNVVFGTFLLLMSLIRYQQEVLEYKARLQAQSITMVQQTKMSSLGEMAAGVAHEINNPLGVILGKAEGLERRVKGNDLEPARLLADFQKIQDVTKRIAKIVNALRTFARNADNDPFVHCRSDELIEDTLSLCLENMKLNNVEIKVTGQKGIQFLARPAQISQVLVSLINNSYDAVTTLPQKWIEIHTEQVADKLRISIADSGPGIPAAIVDKIMQPFFTTKEIGKGAGLGLSTAKGTIEIHDGTLELDRKCEYTKFVIELPIQQQAPSLAA